MATTCWSRRAPGKARVSTMRTTSGGRQIAATAEEVFASADMIVKVKEPQAAERAMLREGQVLFTYLHLAPDPEQTRDLLNSGVTAIAYETVTDAAGGLPLLAPMSEVAGRLAPQVGAWALQKANGGRGVLMGGVPGVGPAEVVVIGGGVVGTQAARIASGMGADVTYSTGPCPGFATSTMSIAVRSRPATPAPMRRRNSSARPTW
jgi:alanine dehydrogenase